MKNKYILKYGLFNWDTLEMQFGGNLSKPENVFTAKAVKIPDYEIIVLERESLGNGWSSTYKDKQTYLKNNDYLILRDNIIIGYVSDPYKIENIKTPLLDIKYANKVIKNFIKTNY